MACANLTVVTIAPRLLTLAEAAQYIGVPKAKFKRVYVKPPIQLAYGVQRYDRKELDSWIEERSCSWQGCDDDVIAKLS